MIDIALDIYSLKLEDTAPDSLLADEAVKAVMQSLSPEGIQVSEKIRDVILYSRIDELDEPVLDFLAHQFHADFYELAATPEMKREAVKSSLLWHMKKGTEWSILKALSMIGVEGEFLHWKDTGDEPYTFRIKAKITGDYYRTAGRDRIVKSIRRAVMESKAARSLFKGLDTSIEFKDTSQIYAGLFDALTGFRIIGLAGIEPPGETRIYAGLASGLQGERRINLARNEAPDTKIYAGMISIRNGAHEIGLEDDVMQELLLRFEQRIFDRLDAIETRMTDRMNEHERDVSSRLDEILEMLRWKGADEEL